MDTDQQRFNALSASVFRVLGYDGFDTCTRFLEEKV